MRKPPFRKVLVANRGEIALRVVRACRELGVPSVAVYSTEDAQGPAVERADEAVCVGPADARRSYLSIPAIIEAARLSGADAIHPGYGFLSEDPDFAEVCEKEGITLIGPPAEVLQIMGDKSAARNLMARAGLPLLPGGIQPLLGLEAAQRLAAEIGYPLIVKAVAGGGGRGMQVVREAGGLHDAYRRARADAQAFFGDSRVYLERYVDSARHVEVQVMCDTFGNVAELGERDCSVQRRNQKLIEESPAPGLPAGLIGEIRQSAVRGAKAAGYVGAGTFEFLVDGSRRYYFMEVNSRVQVEHPVTEMMTGIDIVQEQIAIAGGLPLSVTQDRVTARGAAIECRVNVEDPARGFAPAPGRLTEFVPPGGPFVRVDTYGRPGLPVSAAYDSLLAKVVVWAPDRAAAIARMDRALAEFRIEGPGVHTTIDFLRAVLGTPEFAGATHDTGLVERFLRSASSG
jgi:acetyl-CoA carboxylase biotin carboxylase subunit